MHKAKDTLKYTDGTDSGVKFNELPKPKDMDLEPYRFNKPVHKAKPKTQKKIDNLFCPHGYKVINGKAHDCSSVFCRSGDLNHLPKRNKHRHRLLFGVKKHEPIKTAVCIICGCTFGRTKARPSDVRCIEIQLFTK